MEPSVSEPIEDEDDLPISVVVSKDLKQALSAEEGSANKMESMLVPPRSPTHIHVAEEAQVPSRQHGIEAASAGLSHFTEGEIHAHGSEPIDGWPGAGKEPVLKDLPPTNETLLPRATSDTVPEATPADAAPQATLADGVDPSSAVSSEDQKQDGGSGPVRRTSSRSRQAPAIFSPLAAEASKRKVAVAGREPDTEAPATKKAKKGPAVKLDGEEEASVVGTEEDRAEMSPVGAAVKGSVGKARPRGRPAKPKVTAGADGGSGVGDGAVGGDEGAAEGPEVGPTEVKQEETTSSKQSTAKKVARQGGQAKKDEVTAAAAAMGGDLPSSVPPSSGTKRGTVAKRRLISGPDDDNAAVLPEVPSTEQNILDPSSPEYLALDRLGKEQALHAAVKAYETAQSQLEAASVVLKDHVVAWRKESFHGERDKDLINTFRSIKAKPKEQQIKLSIEAAEVTRLWKFIYENKGSFNTGTHAGITAEMAAEKAPPPPVTTARPQGAAAVATTTAALAVSTDIPMKKDPQTKSQLAAPGSKTEAPIPPKNAARTPLATTAASTTKPSQVVHPAASLHDIASTAPAAGSPVAVVSFPSTGDATRDRTVAALHQALFAGGLVDPSRHTRTPLQAAVATEQHLHVWASGAAKGGHKSAPSDPSSSSSHYLRRSFLLWSLLAPDSEGFCGELRELILSGEMTPEALARMELAAGGKA